MESIINPSTIYWINMLDKLSFLFQTICLVGAIMLVSCGIFKVACVVSSADDDNEIKLVSLATKGLKLSIFAIAVSGIALLLLPSTETAYQMLVFKYLTPDNLNLAGDSVKELVDYVVQQIQSVVK